MWRHAILVPGDALLPVQEFRTAKVVMVLAVPTTTSRGQARDEGIELPPVLSIGAQ